MIYEPDERQLRIDLAAAYRLLAHNGIDDLIYTHTSSGSYSAGRCVLPGNTRRSELA
jgi:ribulose-5-phosphate 4-epimerase/fuculose-1-phosphate aldolase